MKKRNARFLQWRNRTSIRKQLSIIVVLAVTLSIALLIMFNYFTQANANIRQQVSMFKRVLALESRNLDKYVAELRSFSLQLRNNASFMALIAKNDPLTYSEQQTIESAIKISFYSRNDLETLSLFLVRQELSYSLDRSSRKMAMSADSRPLSQWPEYKQFIGKPDFCSIVPGEDGFVQLTRTIIDAPRETPLAIVRFDVNMETVHALSDGHGMESEQLCIFGVNGERYFLPENLIDAETGALQELVTKGLDSQILYIRGQDMLCVVGDSGEYGFALVGLKPMAVINAGLIATRNGSIILGSCSLILTLLLVLYCIRFITTPLSKLAHRIRRVGSGNFTTRAELAGSAELIGLSEDVNEMMSGIHRLIESNYLAQLNERTAQLIALEAQTNPHFLFNTLQAVSTQAILHGQTDIYQMVTALASLLRYSVKEGNLATLRTELDHVEEFLSLQKARFGDRLSYELRIDSTLLDCSVPKLGVLSLVENSITHGLAGSATSITIAVEAETVEKDAVFRVKDNGSGIPPEKLKELLDALGSPSVIITKNIGLTNLASRLRLLYDGQAKLSIQSEMEPVRQTVVIIAIPLEVLKRVQNIAD